MSNNKRIKNICKKLLFNDNFDQLNKLAQYCLTQNITGIESYEDNLDVIVSFIVNELVYVIYHDLTIDSINNNNNNNHNSIIKHSLLFPKLSKMFKLMYNLSCYICCYPFEWKQEYIYVKQYFNLRNTLYKNIFGNNSGENSKISYLASKLNNYNYFTGGSLLHGVCLCGYHQYCEILIKDGFDMKQSNRSVDDYDKTPYKIAQTRNHENILVLFRSLEKNGNNSSNFDDLPVSIMKSMEDICDLLFQQIMFSKYFLLCLGINNVTDDVEMKIKQEKLGNSKREFMSDVLYVPLDKLQPALSVVGINENEINKTNEINGANVMNGILSSSMRLLDKRMIISDELLVLCWVYYNVIDDINDSKSNKISISYSKDEFLQHLLNCVSDCLCDKSIGDDEYNYGKRNYIYFKEFLLHSNIWYCKDIKNNKLLFEYVNNVVDELLIKQKEYIRDSIENEEKQDGKEWNKLCNFDKYNNMKHNFVKIELMMV